ncbi:MAG: hypothetical protein FJX52_15635, partial [Alphaproteobacteria bacterium]|nr:hypothetical protein [Alphaproteobacteria bacterium]
MTAPRRSRNVVVILGMHRSGTSAVARLLAQCGLQLGDDLLTQAELDNPNGYWEPRGIVAVHEALLDRYLDRTWYGPKSCLPYPAQWWQR